MRSKNRQRRSALLVLLLTLVLCLGTLFEGVSVFADTEGGTDSNAATGTTEQQGTADQQASGTTDGTSDEDAQPTDSEDENQPAEANAVVTAKTTKAIEVTTANVSNSLYKNVSGTKKVTFAVKFDTTKDSNYNGYTISAFNVYDAKDKKNVVEGTKLDTKATVAVVAGHTYYVQATATKTDASGKTESVLLQSESKYSVTFPGAVSKVTASCASKDNLIKVTWDKVDGADKYYVYRSTSTTRPSTPLKAVSTNSYSERKKGGSYYYWIQPVNSKSATASSEYTGSEKVTAGNYLTCGVRNYWFTVKTKKKVPIYKSASSKKVVGYLKKGTVVKVKKKSPKKVAQYGKVKRVYFNENGKKGWLTYSSVKLTTHVSGKTNDWSKSVKEAYVNGKKFKSNTNYLIWLSKYTQKVNVFKRANKNSKWVLVKTYRCSTGTFTHPTPTNMNYLIIRKQPSRHRVTNTGLRYYYKYLSCFGKKGSSGHGISFHTICWNEGTNKPQKKVKDRPDTKGCTRMLTNDALWIYKNVPNKTRVVSY